MTDEPEIVRILRKEKILNQQNNASKNNYHKSQMIDHYSKDQSDSTFTIFTESLKSKTNAIGLSDLETLYQTVFENSAVAITVTDENEKIIFWNRYAENLLGMKKDD